MVWTWPTTRALGGEADRVICGDDDLATVEQAPEGKRDVAARVRGPITGALAQIAGTKLPTGRRFELSDQALLGALDGLHLSGVTTGAVAISVCGQSILQAEMARRKRMAIVVTARFSVRPR